MYIVDCMLMLAFCDRAFCVTNAGDGPMMRSVSGSGWMCWATGAAPSSAVGYSSRVIICASTAPLPMGYQENQVMTLFYEKRHLWPTSQEATWNQMNWLPEADGQGGRSLYVCVNVCVGEKGGNRVGWEDIMVAVFFYVHIYLLNYLSLWTPFGEHVTCGK